MSVGIIRADDGTSLRFDSSLESWAPSVTVTEHPIEDGTSIVDHSQIRNLVFTVEGTVTETPFDATGTVQGGPDRVANAKTFLDRAQGALLSVVTTRFGTLRNCLLLGHPFRVTARKAVTFACTFRQVRLAIASFVTIPPEVPVEAVANTVADAQDVGQQALVEDPRGEEVASDMSILFGLAGGT